MTGPTTKPNLKLAVPFFMVTEMDRSLEFYVKGLGFELIEDWKPNGKIKWCWLQRESLAIMLQEYQEGRKPADKLGTGVSICFICQNSLDLYHEFLEKELSPSEPFVGNTMWVVQIKDPDGYDLVFESPTDVPEETMYSDYLKKRQTN